MGNFNDMKDDLPEQDEPEDEPESSESSESEEFSELGDESSIPRELIESIPEEKRGELIRTMMVLREQYSGPIAHPRIIAGYERHLPGSANRILIMAEDQQSHRIQMEALNLRSAVDREKRATYLGFVLGIALIGLGAFAIHSGYALASVAIIGTSVASLAGVFVYSYRTSRAELRRKRMALEQPSVPPGLLDGEDVARPD